MPLRNFNVVLLVVVVSLVCYFRAEHSPYGRDFVEVMELVRSEGLKGEEVSDEAFFTAAMNGISEKMESLGDEYTMYVSPKQLAAFRQELDSRVVGVGIRVIQDSQTDKIQVLSPIYGSPAYEAGIRPGDEILAVNGESVVGIDLRDVTEKITGPEGTDVTLTIRHRGEMGSQDVKITRKSIDIPTVEGHRRIADGQWEFFLPEADKIAYVHVDSFVEETTKDLTDVLKKLQKEGMRGLVLDLRGNPGGHLTTAVEIADLFLPKGTKIVTIKGRHPLDEEDEPTWDATGDGQFQALPLAVLVNGDSASASEIVAACLQDADRAVIVGERSYGKGSVQNVIPIRGGRAQLKLTTNSYWRPSGANIQKPAKPTEDDVWGVSPNEGYAVKLDERQVRDLRMAQERRRYPDVPEDLLRKADGHETDVKVPNDDANDAVPPPGDDAPQADEGKSAKAAKVNPKPKPWPEVDAQLMRAMEYLQEATSEPAEKEAA